MISMRASVHPNPAHAIKGWIVIWFRPEPKTWDYRVSVSFTNIVAAARYMDWHNKWIDENVAR